MHVSALLLCACLGACGETAGNQSSATPPVSGQEAVQPAPAKQQIVFSDFKGKLVTLFINDKQFYRGVIRIDERDESTGIGLVLDTHISGPTKFRLVYEGMDFTTNINITPSIKIIHINPISRPYIDAIKEDYILLD